MKRIFFLLVVLFLFNISYSQNKSTGPPEKTVRQELRKKKQARKESRAKRKLEKAERKAVKKHHKRIQTKAVRKRMKSSKKTSVRVNENKKEFFLKRWFTKSKKGKVKKSKKD
jgi:hypothetical protein